MPLLILWAQVCGLAYDLRLQDTLWMPSPTSLTALGRIARAIELRELRTGIRPAADLFKAKQGARLLQVCQEAGQWRWEIVLNGETLVFLSRPPRLRWLRRHFTLLCGPRTWHPSRIPYKEIELLIPLSWRVQAPEDSSWQANRPWLEEFALPLLALRPSVGRLCGLQVQLRYLTTGEARYRAVALVWQRHADLPFDEVGALVRLRRLPPALRQRFTQLIGRPTHAYALRIQDYYPASFPEAYHWFYLLCHGRELPLPAKLADSPRTPCFSLPPGRIE
ncbi:MAG: hypothetical protein NZ958_01580 [Bacteroidia bacterium]|nr:hypothetical protein [Bacteroidia bacterium]MDW8089355.1 hypothetical protein [Bacteroidia bacterium]